MLKITGTGRISSEEVVVKTTQSGKKMADFNVAFSVEGTDKASFVRVVLFDNYAEAMAKILKKGRRVFLDGELRIENVEKEGKKYTNVTAFNPSIEILDKKQEDQAEDENEIENTKENNETTKKGK